MFPVKKESGVSIRKRPAESATGLGELASAAKLEKICREILDAVRDLSAVVHDAMGEGGDTEVDSEEEASEED